MRHVTRILCSLLVLAFGGGVGLAEGGASSNASHYFEVSYNVALVAVGAIDQIEGEEVGADGTEGNPRVVRFDNELWTAGMAESAFIELSSSLSYTLAGGRNAKVTAKVTGLPTALSILLRTTSPLPLNTTSTDFWFKTDAGTGLNLTNEDAAVIVVAGDVGIHERNLPIVYDFQVDVTQGPAFAPTVITVTYTAQAEADPAPELEED